MRGVVKLFVSGSSSRLGAREASPLLTGRHLTITVFPLSFREFLSFRGVEPSKAARSQAGRDRSSGLLREYLRTGGFPEVVLSDQKADLLSQYFVDVVRRDVVDRHGLRDSARSSSWPSPSRPTSAGVQLR
jgi:predicted AAA+ superfamily ATPase